MLAPSPSQHLESQNQVCENLFLIQNFRIVPDHWVIVGR